MLRARSTTVLLTFLFACGSSGSSDSIPPPGGDSSSSVDVGEDASADSANPIDSTTGETTAADTPGDTPTEVSSVYPPGPYGNAEGDVIPNLKWMGYVDPAADVIATSEPYGPYSLDDARKSGRTYALLHVAEFY